MWDGVFHDGFVERPRSAASARGDIPRRPCDARRVNLRAFLVIALGSWPLARREGTPKWSKRALALLVAFGISDAINVATFFGAVFFGVAFFTAFFVAVFFTACFALAARAVLRLRTAMVLPSVGWDTRAV